MKELTINNNDAGQRLDRFVTKVVPALPSSLIQKYIRLKRIKINGRGAKSDYKLCENDVVQLYISDKFFESVHSRSKTVTSASTLQLASIASTTPCQLDVIYEDNNILLINKPTGMLCYDTRNIEVNTLINHVQAYIAAKGQWQPQRENTFSPALCNRIDRNTSGMVIIAKNAESLRIINEKIKNKEIDKFYLTVTAGIPTPANGLLSGFISKDGKRNLVTVTKKEMPDSKFAETEYKTLTTSECNNKFPIALLECRLITGRTHQIRAQLAHMGYPVLGDVKYGNKQYNEHYNEFHQLLCSYKITFSFTSDSGSLSYLNGKSFQVKNVPFINTYFQAFASRLLFLKR